MGLEKAGKGATFGYLRRHLWQAKVPPLIGWTATLDGQLSDV